MVPGALSRFLSAVLLEPRAALLVGAFSQAEAIAAHGTSLCFTWTSHSSNSSDLRGSHVSPWDPSGDRLGGASHQAST